MKLQLLSILKKLLSFPDNILNEIDSILYAGILSGGFAFVLQIYAQKNITPAPAAIIFSLEGVFATKIGRAHV
mgnify:CR=1 FL=1